MQKKKLLLTAALLLLPIPARALMRQLQGKPQQPEPEPGLRKGDKSHKS